MAGLGKRFNNADMLDQTQAFTETGTITGENPIVLINTASAAATLTLPDPGPLIGQQILLLVAGASGTITLAYPRTGSGIISGGARKTGAGTITGTTIGNFILLESVGEDWAMLAYLGASIA